RCHTSIAAAHRENDTSGRRTNASSARNGWNRASGPSNAGGSRKKTSGPRTASTSSTGATSPIRTCWSMCAESRYPSPTASSGETSGSTASVMPAPNRSGRVHGARSAPPRRRSRTDACANRNGTTVAPRRTPTGMAAPLRRDGAYIVAVRCSYPLRTVAPTGVVQVARGARATVGDLFAVWGQRLTADRLARFRGRVRAFVGGRRWRHAVQMIPLRRHAEIVLEVGGYVPPHHFFLFGASG